MFANVLRAYMLAIALLTAPYAHTKAAPRAADPAAGAALVKQCEGKEDFSDPAPPARIFGNVWYVGTCTVSVLLLTSPKGHILIDAATEQAAPSILANIRAAGFDPRDIRWIVSSHEHFDHVGGLAALQRATGAKVAALKAAAPVLASGKVSPADPQVQEIHGFAPVRVNRLLASGDKVQTGPIVLTARATPGHTEGSTSWTWTSCEGANCQKFTYLDSLSALALGTYRFAQHPARAAMFKKTFAAVEQWRCGIVLTPHPGVSAMLERIAGTEPLLQPQGCAPIVQAARERLANIENR
jgi:metallo-beta-lactamase class B